MPPPLPPPLPPPRPKTWWDRIWPWFAVLGGILVLALFGGGAIAGLSWITKNIRLSGGYQRAIATARADRRVVAALGEPIDDSQSVTGSFVSTNSMHTVIATVPLKGPKGSATMVMNAVQVSGPWQFTVLSVTLKATREVFDLRAAANGTDTSPKQP